VPHERNLFIQTFNTIGAAVQIWTKTYKLTVILGLTFRRAKDASACPEHVRVVLFPLDPEESTLQDMSLKARLTVEVTSIMKKRRLQPNWKD
jgi:hypothetical protein